MLLCMLQYYVGTKWTLSMHIHFLQEEKALSHLLLYRLLGADGLKDFSSSEYIAEKLDEKAPLLNEHFSVSQTLHVYTDY